MVIFLSILVLLLAILSLCQWTKHKAINEELRYIKERIGSISPTSENAYILVPSENLRIKELAAEINRLLDTFYTQKVEYERSRKAMSQVLTNISHDLRTPLTVLKGYSELLNREVENIVETEKAREKDIQEMAVKIDGKAGELTATINEYFTMSKITSGDMKIDLQRVNITQLCHDVILDYYDILEEKNYDVEIEIGPSPEYAYADIDALKRILKNLIDNAITHGGDGKYLALRLKKTSDMIRIEVEDHGQGVLEKEKEQIFDRTYTTAHKGFGSGLGLTIAKNLALQMEADIQMESEPRQNTIFTLILKTSTCAAATLEKS
ncbi:MAG: HAMP domain-containing histidine kinase [Clostridiales bacterium]|nr:HAMP domain-containing histidine kinase [Clostridiales bacterium]